MVSVSKKVLKLPKTDLATSSAYTDSDYGYFEICNLFSELRTEYQKLVARLNLGIKDTGTSGGISEVYWKDIKGDPTSSPELVSWLNLIRSSLTEADTNILNLLNEFEAAIGMGNSGEFLTVTLDVDGNKSYSWKPLSMLGTEEGLVLVTHKDTEGNVSSSWEELSIDEDITVFVPSEHKMGSGHYKNNDVIAAGTPIKEILKNLLTNITGLASAVHASGSLPSLQTVVLPLYSGATKATPAISLSLTSGSYTGDGYSPSTAPIVTWSGDLEFIQPAGLELYNPLGNDTSGNIKTKLTVGVTCEGHTNSESETTEVTKKTVSLPADTLTPIISNSPRVVQASGTYIVKAFASVRGTLVEGSEATDSQEHPITPETKYGIDPVHISAQDVLEVHCVYPIVTGATFLTTKPTSYSASSYPTINLDFAGDPYVITTKPKTGALAINYAYAVDYLAGKKTIYLAFYNNTTVYIPKEAVKLTNNQPATLASFTVKRLADTKDAWNQIEWLSLADNNGTAANAIPYYKLSISGDSGIGKTIVEVSWV